MKDKIGVIILLILPFLIFFITDIINSKKESAIIDFGGFYFGVVTKKTSVGNAGSNNINYFINIDSEKKDFSRLISKPYWRTLEVGDTVLVKAIISDTLTLSIILEDKKHLIPCLKEYEQPADGWKKLPIDECK